MTERWTDTYRQENDPVQGSGDDSLFDYLNLVFENLNVLCTNIEKPLSLRNIWPWTMKPRRVISSYSEERCYKRGNLCQNLF